MIAKISFFTAPVEFSSMIWQERVAFSIDFPENIWCWQLAFSCQTVKLPPPKWLTSQIHLGFYLWKARLSNNKCSFSLSRHSHRKHEIWQKIIQHVSVLQQMYKCTWPEPFSESHGETTHNFISTPLLVNTCELLAHIWKKWWGT